MPAIILVRGAGDLATGVALRLHRAGLNVVMTELAAPLAVRRSVSYAEAIYEGSVAVESVAGRRVDDPSDSLKILSLLAKGQVPVLVDPEGVAAHSLHPLVIIDGRMRKLPPEPLRHSALLYVGLGPGFTAPDNCHAVIETDRGHTLGRVIWQGTTLADTAAPEGDPRRVLRAPSAGVFKSAARIGDHFEAGQTIAQVEDWPIVAPFAGVLRGLLRPETKVEAGLKVGDIDPRDDPRLCRLISDKSLAVGGGVLEAILSRAPLRSQLWA
jgi:xanthine dehydrogenase accessory factor